MCVCECVSEGGVRCEDSSGRYEDGLGVNVEMNE